MNINVIALQWPEYVPRTDYRISMRHGTLHRDAINNLDHLMQRLGLHSASIGFDSYDPGVVLYYHDSYDHPRMICCDKYHDTVGNMVSIHNTLKLYRDIRELGCIIRSEAPAPLMYDKQSEVVQGRMKI